MWISRVEHIRGAVGWHMNESCCTYEWVMSHIWMSHVTHMNEFCHTYEWVILRTKNRWFVMHVNERHVSSCRCTMVSSYMWMREISHSLVKERDVSSCMWMRNMSLAACEWWSLATCEWETCLLLICTYEWETCLWLICAAWIIYMCDMTRW